MVEEQIEIDKVNPANTALEWEEWKQRMLSFFFKDCNKVELVSLNVFRKSQSCATKAIKPAAEKACSATPEVAGMFSRAL